MDWERYIGIVIVRNITDPVCLEVFCPELTPLADGEIKPVLGGMSSGEGEVKLGKTISCVFYGSTNRSIPDMHIGEQVMVKRYPDSDIWYWEPIGRDDKLRMTEHLKFYILDKPIMEGEVLDTNCYFFEMDSRPEVKHILLQTAITDGEPFIYTFKIDTRLGTVMLMDSLGNFCYLETAQHRWTWQNVDRSMVQLDKTTINIFSVDTINMTTKTLNVVARDINRTVENNVTDIINNDQMVTIKNNNTLTVMSNHTENVTGNWTRTVGGQISDTATGNITIKTSGSIVEMSAMTHTITTKKFLSNRVIGTIGGPALGIG